MKIELESGLVVEIEHDEDGFPTVRIDTQSGFLGDNDRPTVEVVLNDIQIHDMFQDGDFRWCQPDQVCGCGKTSEGVCPRCGQDMQ